jgi:hypothetical protein
MRRGRDYSLPRNHNHNSAHETFCSPACRRIGYAHRMVIHSHFPCHFLFMIPSKEGINNIVNVYQNSPFSLFLTAERKGFEPLVLFHTAHTLSRRAPSTTRSPLPLSIISKNYRCTKYKKNMKKKYLVSLFMDY